MTWDTVEKARLAVRGTLGRMRSSRWMALVAAMGCTPPPPAEAPSKSRNACEAVAAEKEPRLALLGCARDKICESFVSRGVARKAGAPRGGISCESRIPLLPLTAPIFRLRLRTGNMYDSVLLYRAVWQGERWQAELIDELPVEAERSSMRETPGEKMEEHGPATPHPYRLAHPPILSFEVRAGVGVVREQSGSGELPLLLSPMNLTRRVEGREGTSLWLALDLRWWTRREQAGVEAYRVLLHEALGHTFVFEAERQGLGGILNGICSCGVQRRWQLPADEWQALREKGVKILDAEPHGSRCGRDGYSTIMEALADGRWRVVERACEDVGEVLSFLRTREKELVDACSPQR